MSLETTSLRALDNFFREFFSKDCFATLYRVLSTEFRDNPKQGANLPSAVEGISFPQGMKKYEKFLLLTSIWYYREDPMSFYIQLDCQRLFGRELENEYSVLCSSKTLALGFWLSQEEWNDRDFFGNITRLRNHGNVFTLVHLRREKTSKVEKYTGYCRGYSESGRYTPYRSKSVLKEKLLTEIQVEQRRFLRLLKLQYLLRLIEERLRMELR